ncbi:hypothetical protein UB37_07380 [Photobacterium iliopiscarium]|uniref:DUF2357 domain-containing protein n=1 Tax=Photobacterium iliopiscarium TaxID=56192 RepID=A0ABX5GSP2_9GAMM|nr:DUF2357 domain-containing protein [Photobacterium iliopiscarium]KJG23056.1 hypothetical protein UB37_07380 [Photobacterium iliopiscarium]PSW96640.1 DUF2357 domain-containing protein [Photobacterium iliopiscarium]
MNKVSELAEFGQLYSQYQQNNQAALLLDLQHYFISALQFDPVTMQPIEQSLSQICNSAVILGDSKKRQDRLTRLLDHCFQAIKRILAQPRTTIIREHEMVPVYKAQRIDNRSIEWLSRQPGRNVREKLAAQPHVLAQARKESYDISENRLLKAMLIQLEDLLFSKQSCGLNDQQDQVIDLIQQSLRVPLFKAVKPWQHMPPNNVLMQDKQYRKIWDSWQAIQQLDQQLKTQQQEKNALLYFIFKEIVTQLLANPQCHLIEQSWLCDYHQLSLPIAAGSHYQVEGIVRNERAVVKPFKLRLLSVQIIELQMDSQIYRIDFLKDAELITSQLNGHVDNSIKAELKMVEPFVQKLLIDAFDCQRSYRGKVRLDKPLVAGLISIELGHSKPLLMLDQSNPLRLNSLLMSDQQGLDCRYSRAFNISHAAVSGVCLNQDKSEHASSELVELLAKIIKPSQAMHYLVSDHHSDFATINLRRDFNRCFTNASPLPRSIAAVYDLLGSNKIALKADDLFLIIDNSGDALYVTPVMYKLYANKNKATQIYFERHPTLKIQGETEKQLLTQVLKKSYPHFPQSVLTKCLELFSFQDLSRTKFSFTFKENNEFYTIEHHTIKSSLETIVTIFQPSELSALFRDINHNRLFYVPLSRTIICPKKGVQSNQWYEKINLVRGSQTLLQKKQNEQNGLFWKDHLPQLSTRLLKNGQEIPFFFVRDNISIKPVRDKAVDIPISEGFELPEGEEIIEFKVTQGKGKLKTIFPLTLSLKHKLKWPLTCQLELSYCYGDEQPYELRFIPIDDNAPFSSIKAEWGKPEKNEVNVDFYYPEFPQYQTIAQLREVPKKGSTTETTNIIDWMVRNLDEVLDYEAFYTKGSSGKRITIDSSTIDWIPNRDFGFERSYLDSSNIFIHKDELHDDFSQGEHISGNLVFNEKKNGYSLKEISPAGQLPKPDLNKLRSRLRFPLVCFNDYARDYRNPELSREHIDKIDRALQAVNYLVQYEKIPSWLYEELSIIAAYFHKNLPSYLVEKLLTGIEDKKLFRDQHLLYSYALGDVSQQWQQQLLDKILQSVDDSGGTRAVSLDILSVAVWRHPDVIHKLSLAQVTKLVERLTDYLDNEIKYLKPTDKPYRWALLLRRLELMLAILRCRGSHNLQIKDAVGLFSDLSELMKDCWLSINDNLCLQLHQKMQQSDSQVSSRVKLAVDKPTGYENTPDILYALKLYLTGEDGASQISITELIDSD